MKTHLAEKFLFRLNGNFSTLSMLSYFFFFLVILYAVAVQNSIPHSKSLACKQSIYVYFSGLPLAEWRLHVDVIQTFTLFILIGVVPFADSNVRYPFASCTVYTGRYARGARWHWHYIHAAGHIQIALPERWTYTNMHIACTNTHKSYSVFTFVYSKIIGTKCMCTSIRVCVCFPTNNCTLVRPFVFR